MSRHRITLELHEATTEQLLDALSDAVELGRRCDAQGEPWHDWGARAEAIRVVLAARRAIA